jgi:CheY-like chemotaxis protein
MTNTMTAPQGTQARVLIVDDDKSTRLLCSINLQLDGFAVLEAADGRGALEQALLDCPDLVLTDVHMPALDGFQLAEALRSDSRTRQVPLIFLTSDTTSANEARAKALGALAYVTKPFDPATLGAFITGTLALARKRAESSPRLTPDETGNE